jgi:hypothetical protein
MAGLVRSARQRGAAFRPVRHPLSWVGSAGRGGMASVLHPMCPVMAQTAIRGPVEAHVRARWSNVHGGNGHRDRGVCGWHLRQPGERDQRDEPRDKAGPLHGLRLSSAVATNDDFAGFMVLQRIRPVGVGPGVLESSSFFSMWFPGARSSELRPVARCLSSRLRTAVPGIGHTPSPTRPENRFAGQTSCQRLIKTGRFSLLGRPTTRRRLGGLGREGAPRMPQAGEGGFSSGVVRAKEW